MLVRIIATDLKPGMSAACRRADEGFAVPPCREPEFIPALLDICEREDVALVVPTIDTELESLSASRETFQNRGTQIAVSDPSVVRIARNKLETIRFLEQAGIRAPRTLSLKTYLENPEALRFPLILKRIDGSSSIGIKVCQTIESVRTAEVLHSSYVAQELRVGKEYTVNMFLDREGPRAVVPHLRCETRAGEVSKGVTQRVPELLSIGWRLGGELKKSAFGALCFQAIMEENGEAFVFEINARFGGGYPLTDYAGARFAKWLLELTTGISCSAHDQWRENVAMLRYDSAVFVEGHS